LIGLLTFCEINQDEGDQAIKIITEFRRAYSAQFVNQLTWERDAAANSIFFHILHYDLISHKFYTQKVLVSM